MKILDWYILKKFIVTYFFTVVLLVSVLIIVDLAEKIEDFSNPKLTAWIIIRDYYLNFIPYFANMLSPLMIFIAAVFVTANMAAHTEIVAILSSGTSLARILVPFVAGSTIIGFFVFFLIGWTIPNANKVRLAFEDTYVREKYYFNERNVHIKIAPKIYVYLESYDNIANVGYRFTIENVDGLNLLSKLEATRINWDSTKRKWVIPSYKKRIFEKNKQEKIINHSTPTDTVLPIRPKDFESRHKLNERLTLTELDQYIAELKLRGADDVETYLVEKYERFAYPFCIVILTVIGVIVAARKSREGTGFQIAFGFVLAFVYIFLLVISRGFAQKGGIPPFLAAWIPNLVFCLIGFVMYRRVPK